MRLFLAFATLLLWFVSALGWSNAPQAGPAPEALPAPAWEGNLREPTGGNLADPNQTAREILASPLYPDRGVAHEANWLGNAASTVGDWIRELLRRLFGGLAGAAGEGIQVDWLVPVAWALLGLGTACLLVFAFLQFRWKAERKRRKAGGLLEEDEPERTLDEWLELSHSLESEGRHREAVRCLYIASLLRLDEANVMRFIRSQTNWEHLARFEASPRRPQNLDLRPLTRSFDLVWYGYRPTGPHEVGQFRLAYETLCATLAPTRQGTPAIR